jgi:hypothetical protein
VFRGLRVGRFRVQRFGVQRFKVKIKLNGEP